MHPSHFSKGSAAQINPYPGVGSPGADGGILMPMKVGLLIDHWDPRRGGAEACMDLLARHLVRAGHEVCIVGASAQGELPGPFQCVRGMGLSRGVRERRLGRNMTAAARGLGCDVTVAVRHVEQPSVLWLHGGAHLATLEARWRAAHRGRALPAALAVRGRHRTFVDLERRALAGAERGGAGRVICPSPLVAAELKRCHPKAAIPRVVIENGVDLERFHPGLRADARAQLHSQLGLPTDLPLIVTGARNPLLKGVPHLLRALHQVPGPWCFVLAGPKRARAWARRARRAGLKDEGVRVLADLAPEILAAGADLCVQPTWRDPCPLVTLEALAAGTPVVTTALSGLATCVEQAGGVVIPDPSCEDALAAAVTRSLAEPPSPERVRAAVADRGVGPWMEAVEAVLLES